MTDIFASNGMVFLASRLKRLAERLQADCSDIIAAAGLPVQPGQFPLLAALDESGPMSVSALVEALGISQPAVTQGLRRLASLGLVETARGRGDQRQRIVSLSAQGQALMATARRDLWPRIESAVNDLCDGLSGPLLAQVAAIESGLAAAPLGARGTGLVIREFSDALAPAFHDINAEWIDTMFRMEDTDREVLQNPRHRIIDTGGTILFVEAAGLGIVGACALQKTGERQFELTKMGVRESARGRKAGEFLLEAIIARAHAMGADMLYLLTNALCAPAIHLYEKLGFVHDAAIMRDFGARYERCDVAMRYRPDAASLGA